MQFTKYYSNLLSANGEPHLSLDQHKRLFNIISLECRIDELERINNNFGYIKDLYLRKEKLKAQLENLTCFDSSAEVMEDMLGKSRQEI